MLGSLTRDKSAPIPPRAFAWPIAAKTQAARPQRDRPSAQSRFMLPGHSCPGQAILAWNVQVDADHVEPFVVLPVAAPRGADGVDGMRDGLTGKPSVVFAALPASRLRAP